MKRVLIHSGSSARRVLIDGGWGTIPFLVIVSLVAIPTLSTGNLFVYNSFLLASMGALALNLVLGTAGQVSMANPALLAVGAFVTVWAERSGLQFPSDVIVGALAAGVVGVVTGIPSVRLKGLYFALTGLAALYIVVYFAQLYQNDTVGAAGFTVPLLFAQQGLVKMQVNWAWFLLVLVCLLLALYLLLTKSRAGRAWRMIRDNEIVASALGVHTTRYKISAFAISSVIIGLQGGLTAHIVGSVTTDNYTLDVAISYLAMVFIGGVDSALGATIGAAIVTWLPIAAPNVLANFFPNGSISIDGPQIAEICYGALIVIFVMCSPNGIVGLLRRAVSGRPGLRRTSTAAAAAVPAPGQAPRLSGRLKRPFRSGESRDADELAAPRMKG
jgi:branched-chain amino acid transport system permease protein